MKPALIKLKYKQIIAASAVENEWEQNIIDASYEEFMKAAEEFSYAGLHHTLSGMIETDKRAMLVHRKASLAIEPCMQQLDNRIPKLKDNEGNGILYSRYRFHIIDSEAGNKEAHKVCITYYTETLTLIDNVDTYLLLASGDHSGQIYSHIPDTIIDTFMVKVVPCLSVYEYVPINIGPHADA